MFRRHFLTITCVFTIALAAPADEQLPTGALARLGSYKFCHGPGSIRAILSPDGSRIASMAQDHSWSITDQVDERVIVLWDSATGQRTSELRVPHAPIWCMRFSPDGERLAVKYGHGKKQSCVAIFDIATGKLQKNIARLKHSMSLVRFSKDGKSLFFSDVFGKSLVQWNMAKDKQLRRWTRVESPSRWLKERERVHWMVPTADGKFIAHMVDRYPDYSKLPPGARPRPHLPSSVALIIVDAATNKPLFRKDFAEGRLDRFAFSHDGRRFVTGSITVHETATGKELFTLNEPSMYSFTLSPEGRWVVATTGESQVRLWDLHSRKRSHELFYGLTYVDSQFRNEQIFSADGKSVLFVTSSTLRLFDTATGKERLSLGHRSPITPRFSADGRTLFTTCNEIRRSWDVSSLVNPKLLKHSPKNAWEGICGAQVIAHSADGRYFVADNDDQTYLRETASGRVIRKLEGRPDPIYGMFSQDSTRMLFWHNPSNGDSDLFDLYDPKTGKKTGKILMKNLVGYHPAISPDGKYIAWANNTNAILVHDGVTGRHIRTLKPAERLPATECNGANLLFSPDGKHLIVTTYKHEMFNGPDTDVNWATLPTRVFNVESGREVVRFYSNPKTTNKALKHACVACSPDSQTLAVAEKESGTIRLFDIPSGKMQLELTGHHEGVHAMAFSPDSRTLASGGDDGITILWDVSGLDARKEP